VIGEAEVVVRAEVDHLAAVDGDAGELPTLDASFGLVQSLRLQAGDLGGEELNQFAVGHGRNPVG
jgi:hypothetical protein